MKRTVNFSVPSTQKNRELYISPEVETVDSTGVRLWTLNQARGTRIAYPLPAVRSA